MRHPTWVLLCLVGGIIMAGSIALAAPNQRNHDMNQNVIEAASGPAIRRARFRFHPNPCRLLTFR